MRENRSSRWAFPRQPNALAFILVSVVSLPLLLPFGLSRAAILAFDFGAFGFFLLSFNFIWSGTADQVQKRVRKYDGGQSLLIAIAMFTSLAVTAALTQELSSTAELTVTKVVLPVASLILVWVFSAVVFALHYAHEFYSRPVGGLLFPEDSKMPDMMDFLYFAFTIAMTFQVSDVTVSSSRIRRTVLIQSIVSFGFNVFILALSINVLGSAF